MLVQTAIVALLAAAAPALVHATAIPASGMSKEETIVKVKSVITSIKEKQPKTHRCVYPRTHSKVLPTDP
jgi:hypothetical protein